MSIEESRKRRQTKQAQAEQGEQPAQAAPQDAPPATQTAPPVPQLDVEAIRQAVRSEVHSEVQPLRDAIQAIQTVLSLLLQSAQEQVGQDEAALDKEIKEIEEEEADQSGYDNRSRQARQAFVPRPSVGPDIIRLRGSTPAAPRARKAAAYTTTTEEAR